MVFKVAPMKSSFMAASIIGFFVSSIYVSKYSATWAFAFAFVFLLMFVASLISMTYAPIDYMAKRK